MTNESAVPGPGVVTSVNLSERKTVRKTRGTEGVLLEDRGLAGDFAENITTKDFDLMALPVGSVVRVGDEVVLEISQIGKVCHTKCAIYYQAGDCVMPREGVFAVVRHGGPVRVGDAIV